MDHSMIDNRGNNNKFKPKGPGILEVKHILSIRR